MPRDNTNSSFELALAEHALARGATPGQVISLIQEWDTKHGVPFKEGRLRKDILPAALAATETYRREYEKKVQRQKSTRASRKTKARVMALVGTRGSIRPSEAAEALDIGLSAATMQLWRLAKAGVLVSNRGIYRAAPSPAADPPPCSLEKNECGSIFHQSLDPQSRCKRRAVLSSSYNLLKGYANILRVAVSDVEIAGWCNAAVKAEGRKVCGRGSGEWARDFIRLGILTIEALSPIGANAVHFHRQLNAFYRQTGRGGSRIQASLAAYMRLCSPRPPSEEEISECLQRLVGPRSPGRLCMIVEAIAAFKNGRASGYGCGAAG
ncbi:MAG: hypothetical protein U0R19_41475 [Bryobacteraceae bacterium]